MPQEEEEETRVEHEDDELGCDWDTERFVWLMCLTVVAGFLIGFALRAMSMCQPVAVTVHLTAMLQQS